MHEAVLRSTQTPWGWLLGGVAVLLAAALVWAALTAWSSAGALVAGLTTLLVGLGLSVPELQREIAPRLPELLGRWGWYVVTPMTFLLVGSLLLAAGLGAAGARRLRR